MIANGRHGCAMPDLGRMVRLGATVWSILTRQLSARSMEYALPWGRSGMAHSCRLACGFGRPYDFRAGIW